MPGNKFDYDYFERGPQTGKSCYENYRWLPDKTIPAVMSYIDYLGIERDSSVLDFGCAKGHYVKAFRLLGRKAWGCDISEYAILSCNEDVKPYLKLCTVEECVPFDRNFDHIIAKDVFEHVELDVAGSILAKFKEMTESLFVIVPLAKDGRYIVPEDELDVTHIVRQDRDAWACFFRDEGWKVAGVSHQVPGLKEHQTRYSNGVGFFTLTPRK